MRYVFHLSIPVADLTAAKDFYEATLGADVGRSEADWVDILLWGHQITLQHQPKQILLPDAQGERHFGVVLPWQEWESLAKRLKVADIEFLSPPEILYESTIEEQAKFYLQDPSFNVIEVKTYRNLREVLGVPDDGYPSGGI